MARPRRFPRLIGRGRGVESIIANRANGHGPAVARYLADIGASSAEAEDLVVALTRRAAGETVDVDGLSLEPDLLRSVPEALAFENRILPVHRAGGILFVAVPEDEIPEDGLAEVEHLLGLNVEPIPVGEIDVAGVLVKAHQLLRRRARAAAPKLDPTPAPLTPGPSLSDLGMPAEILKRLRLALSEPQGLILLAGPRGSGKSATLRAVVADLQKKDLRVAVLDRSHGVVGLEAELAGDPDALAVDGLESPTVAALAVRAALEGRRVVIAVEAADAAGAVSRLAELKVDPHLVRRALRAGLSQRLLRRVCAACRVQHPEDAATLEDLRLESLLKGVPLWRGRGCEACGKTGYQGRVAAFEYGDRGADRSLRAGFQPLVADALAKMLSGQTSLQELADQVPFTQILQAADRLNVKRVKQP